MQDLINKKDLRSFGLIVGGIFALIGVWPALFRAATPRWWSVILAVLLAVPALIYPKALYWPHKGWMLLGHVLGWINTRIILGAVFYLIVTPIGTVRRLMGKDPMGMKKSNVETYRVPRKSRPASHLKRQY
jgi:hypothetical protein